MKNLISHYLFVFLILTSFPCFSQLNGIYTIGGTTPNYNTVTDAVNDLNNLGVAGLVVFKIRTGTYNEIINLNNVSGTSATNQIVFESESGDPLDVILSNSSLPIQSNYTSFLTLKNLTINSTAGGISFFNGSFFTVNNCIINVNTSSPSGYAVSLGYFSDVEIINSSISSTTGGVQIIWGNGIKLTNVNIQSTLTSINGGSTNTKYVLIDSIITSDIVSITCINVDSVSVKNSDINKLYINNNNGTPPLLIENNILTHTSIGGFTECLINNNLISSNINYSIGIRLYDCQSPIIRNNRIYMTSGTGIEIENTSGTITYPGIISNNFISIKTSNTFYGVTLKQSCSYIDILNNSFFCLSPVIASAIFRAYIFSGANNRIINNNCVINGLGNFYDYGITTAGFSNIDYNNLYYKDINGKTSYFPYHSSFCWNEGRKMYGFDLNSISVNPIFTNDSLLYPLNSALDSAGLNVGISTDIDGNIRNVQYPDIGAVEFNKIFIPLNGIYSIGSSGDFLTISAAIDSLEKVGGKDSVIFEIQPGIYTDEIAIQYIHKYSNDLVVKFVSTSSNTHDVSIETITGPMLTLVGASKIWFENISFKIDNVSYSKHLMTLEGDVDVTFNKCYFLFDPLGTTFNQEMILFNECNTYSDTKIVFNEDTIRSTNFVMNMKGNNSYENHITISNCFINDKIGANTGPVKLIDIDKFSYVSITNNEIRSYADAVILNSCNDSISITHNLIRTNTTWSSKSMIIMNDCNTNKGYIYNNFLIPGSVYSNVVSYGIELFNSDSLHIMHNSIKGIHPIDISFFSSNSYSCKVYNNIFMGTVKVLDSLHYFNYNNLKNVEYNSINYGNNLSLLQSSTGTNLNSINQNPTFTSVYDLHINNPWLRVGQAALIVTDDIDKEGRHPVVPYIGADEFCQHPASSFIAYYTCEGDSTLLVNNSTNLDSLSSLTWDIYANGSIDYTGTTSVLLFFDSAGTYPIKIFSTNTNGCKDSSIINVVIGKDSVYNEANLSICQGDSMLIYGNYQSVAGTYYDSLQTINGCDSVLSTTLTIDSSYLFNQNQSICQGDSMLIYGNYQSVAGTYYDSLQTINGCDSVLSITLLVNQVYLSNTNDTICQGDSVLIYGNYENTAGVYYDSLQSILGCDSVLATTLFLNANFNSNQNQEICQGDSILIYGTYQYASGVYYDSLQTINGCDSVLSTTLIVNPLPNVTLTNFNPDTICSTSNAVTLPNGSPSGGVYSGTGVSGGTFDPNTAGLGTHSVIYTYTDVNSCINSDSTFITVEQCVGIDDLANDFGVLIYPNPNTGLFTIEKSSELDKEVNISLLDASSRVIIDKLIPKGQQKIEMDITSYSKGVYYLQMTIGDKVYVKQILKN